MEYKKKSVLKNISEKVVEPIIKFLNFPLAYIAGRSENMEKAIFRPIVKSYSKHSVNNIIQYTTFPKQTETIPIEYESDKTFKDYAIILQGPIRTDEQFTINSVKYYKRCYPEASIIVSTWNCSDELAKSEVQKIGGIWIENNPPESAGAGNVNMQLTSSLAGVKKAKELGCRYAVKTRTDQRLYANDVLQYFSNLQEAYPSADPEIVARRLVYTSWGKSFRYLPFQICDFIVFGETDELIKLYSIQMDSRAADFHNLLKEEEDRFTSDVCNNLEINDSGLPYKRYRDFEDKYYKYMFAEQYIVYQYFSENICKIHRGDDLMDAYYTYLKKYAIIADSEKLMIYWPKYSIYNAKYENETSFPSKLDFKKWLEIYLHYESKKEWIMSKCTKKVEANEFEKPI